MSVSPPIDVGKLGCLCFASSASIRGTNGVNLVSGLVTSHRAELQFSRLLNADDLSDSPVQLLWLQTVMETTTSSQDPQPTKTSQQLQLLAFPDEILLAVLWFVPAWDLFTLATLSKKLHHLALAVYLELHGLPSDASGDLALDPKSLQGLPGLQIVLSQLTFRRLTCTFPTTQDAFLTSITGLRGLVKRLTRLEEVILEFNPIETASGSQELDPLSWTQPLERLMSGIASNGCTSVILRGGLTSEAWLQSHVPPSPPPPSPASPTTFLSKMRFSGTIAKKLKKLGNRSSCHVLLCVSERIAEDPITPSILNLDVSSAMFFFRILPEWTLRTLNSAPLTALSLHNIAYPDPSDWHIVLSSLTVPSLQIPQHRLLSHHLPHPLRPAQPPPSLRTLTIDDLFEHRTGDAWYPLGPETHAPGLKALIAPVRYIPQFLSCERIAPNLKQLTILAADVHRAGVPELARVWWHVLDRVAERAQGCTLRMDITLPYYDGFKHLLIEGDSAVPYLARTERLAGWLDCFSFLGELEILDGEGEHAVLGDEERRAFVHEMMPFFVRIAKVRLGGRSCGDLGIINSSVRV
ncbi:hypothetical protein LshimejAT787_0210980 [Lyophyllum shimeji]|uniref:F-box domain-containing protein n=1 Tax=Lyophyllum shimeji TaxID=47721 RepID=A0A9P3PGJ3_LYOSH|nr:hypothetical protein LshimejAT787_0210980 [Lyophyllum shimeji]